MRLLHISDLHLGKTLYNYSLIEDQKFILNRIIDILIFKKVEVLIIAGDIYDTKIANNEALNLYKEFIDKVIFDLNIKVIAISGNHDSSNRLSQAQSFYKRNNYYVYGDFIELEKLVLEDEYGKVNFYPISFISMTQAKILFDTEEIESFTDIYKLILKDIDYRDRNVLITHCYAGLYTYESEEYNEDQKPLTIGNSDCMDAHLFEKFDYVALGHLHFAHKVLKNSIRYSGSPLKYSFSEKDKKSVTFIDLKQKAEIETIELRPIRKLVTYEDSFENLIQKDPVDDYVEVILTNETLISDPIKSLRKVFKNICSLKYKNNVISKDSDLMEDNPNIDPLSLFNNFYKYKMDKKMNKDMKKIIENILEEINETN